MYNDIKQKFKGKKVEEQKIFYIIYIFYQYKIKDYEKIKCYIDTQYNNYIQTTTSNKKRPLITADFKAYIDSNIDQIKPQKKKKPNNKSSDIQ